MEITDVIIKVSVFLIVAVVSYNAIQSGFNYGTVSSVLIAICVAALAVICFPDQLTVLLSEFAWGILLLMVLVAAIMVMSIPKGDRHKRTSEREDSGIERPAVSKGNLNGH